ncbi:MAG: 30S ribosomal protein S21 [Candidatus Paceibacterota bacterium]
MIKVNKRENENFNSLFYRFKKKVRQSGILLEARKRRFHSRPENKNKRRKSAIHRVEKEKEIKNLKRYGELGRGRRR